MQYRNLGDTDIRVSVVSMGCWAIAGGELWGPQDHAQAEAAIHASLDAGVNFFDTAEIYGDGESEAILGRALEGRRHEAIIATKVSSNHLTADDVAAACERSLRRLRTDVIDLYQVHWPNPDVPMAETVGALQRLKTQGKVRSIGVSNFGVTQLEEFAARTLPVTNQVCYSMLFRAVEYAIQPACVSARVGILCYSPLAQGLLTGKFATPDDVPEGRARSRHFSCERKLVRHGEPGCEPETFDAIARVRAVCDELGEPMGNVALAWLLAQPGVTAVLSGARNADQATRNARAGDLDLGPEWVARLDDATDVVKARLGPNPDMWQADTRIK